MAAIIARRCPGASSGPSDAGRPLPQPEQGVGDAWILIAFIVALGLIFVVAAWVLAGSDVPAERESNGQGIIASSTPT